MMRCWVLALLSLSPVSAQQTVVHGSGTTNPKTYFVQIMQMLEDRILQDVRLTYRAVGSSTGQREFSQVSSTSDYSMGLSDFGSGDIPMTNERWQAMKTAGRDMVHVPFCLGAIGIFHSVPPNQLGPDGLKLTPCVLAKIFSGQITRWDDQAIKDLNAGMQVPAGQKIMVGHRKLGSSSTGGFTKYLAEECPDNWKNVDGMVPLGSGSTITWPTSPAVDNFQAVEGSPGMTKHIQNTPYAIGYIDAGHGHIRKFSEVKLQNKDGTFLTSTEAIEKKDANDNNGVAAAGQSAMDAGGIPISVTDDWSNVNLNGKAGPNTWPIVLVSYIYLNKNMSSMDPKKAALLRAFVDFVTGTRQSESQPPMGQDMLESYSFNRIPAAMNKWVNTRDNVISWPNYVPYTFESDTQKWTGQGPNVISAKRIGYPMWKLNELELEVKTLSQMVHAMKDGLDDYGIVPLHGSGTTNPKNWFANAMKIMEHQARVPMMLTYRAVGSSTGQKEFIGQTSNQFKSYNHFGAGDIPMSRDRFSQLRSGDKMVHLPFALGAIGIFHNVPSDEMGGDKITLDACLLAEIFSGTVTTWDDAKVKAQNPKLTVPAGSKIMVGHRTLGSSSTGGVAGYLNKKCSSNWNLGTGSKLSWPDKDNFIAVQGSPGMQTHIKDTKYSIGYLDAGHGHDFGFSEVALKNADNEVRTSKESIALGGVSAAGAAAVTNSVFPSDHEADWSDVNLYDMAGKNTWPIVLVSYMYVKKDQTKTNPRTAAALQAFIDFILNNRHSLCEKFGFAVPPAEMKAETLKAARTIEYPPMTNFTFEESTDVYNGMGDDVLSAKRHSYDDYERAAIDADVQKLKTKFLEFESQIASKSSSGGISSQPAANSTVTAAQFEQDDGLAIASLIVGIVALLLAFVGICLAIKAGKGQSQGFNAPATNYGNQAA